MITFTHGRATVEASEHAATVRIDDRLVITVLNNGQYPTNHTDDPGDLVLGFVALMELTRGNAA